LPLHRRMLGIQRMASLRRKLWTLLRPVMPPGVPLALLPRMYPNPLPPRHPKTRGPRFSKNLNHLLSQRRLLLLLRPSPPNHSPNPPNRKKNPENPPQNPSQNLSPPPLLLPNPP